MPSRSSTPTFFISETDRSSKRSSAASSLNSWTTCAEEGGGGGGTTPANSTGGEGGGRSISSLSAGPQMRLGVVRNSSSPSLRRTSFPSLQKPNRASIASVLSCDYVLPEEQPSSSTSPPLPPSAFHSSSPLQHQPTSPGSPSSITFPTCASPLNLSRPSSSLSHHRLSRTYSTPTVPPASMLFAGGPTSPPARASTGISTGMGAVARVRSQSPSLLSRVGRAAGGGRVMTRAKTMMGSVGAERSREAGGEETLEDEVSRKRYEKRTKVVKEIWESEKVYVEGLDVIIKHFLNPLLATSEDPYPILPKKIIQELFQNITQIHSFSLTLLAGISTCLPLPLLSTSATNSPSSAPAHQLTTPIPPVVLGSSSSRQLILPIPELSSSATSTLRAHSPRSSPRPLSLPAELLAPPTPIPVIAPIAKVLSEHAPFMSLYHPFISNFATSSKLLSDLRKEGGPFAKWLSEREKHEGCKKLRLGDWLLSVVQRVPRYLLLIKDLLKCTPEEDPEKKELEKVLEVVDKITDTLNARLHDIAATQKLIALHRSFTSLPYGFSFVVPGRRLLKQGDLVKVCRRRDEDRTFWLFTDCLIYGTTASTSSFPLSSSRSVAGLSNWMALMTSPAPQDGSSFVRTRTKSESNPSHSPHVSTDFSTSSAGDKGRFVFHRKLELEDLTVVGVEDSKSSQFSFELLSPDKSFAVVACSQEEKEEWMDAIRDARMELLSSLRTLKTDEEHTMRRHRRRSLQAMPFPSILDEEHQASSLISPSRLPTHPNQPSNDSGPASAGGGSFASSSDGTSSLQSKQTIESFIAAVWVPDSRTEKCMRCHEPFTVFRRRHHCRLCGLVCCHWCSTKTFTINDSTKPNSSAQPVRACDPCYSALFTPSSANPTSPSSSLNRTRSSSVGPDRPPSLTNHSSQHSDSSAPSTPNDSSIPLPDLPSDSSTPSRSNSRPRPRTGASDSPTTSFSSSSSAIDDSSLPPGLISNRRTSGLATLRLESPTTSSSDGSDVRNRRLSGTNNRFSIFVGGGQGGPDWGGRGEISSRHSSGDSSSLQKNHGGDVAYGAVAGRLRSVLREQAARSGKNE